MIHVIDTLQLGRPRIIAATALETNDGIALFDAGPESTFDHVTTGLEEAGISPNDIRHVFLSHIHFDHAGAAWRFADLGARIYVHPRGAPHLLDPSKLIESATRIFGDQMERLWGKFAPVPADRLTILEDGQTVNVSPFTVRAIETPGHASHHHVYHWDDNVFGGDIAGVRIGSGPPIPPFVPPELHVESWRASIAKIRALNAANLYLPHFGKAAGPINDLLDALDERVARWSQWFREQLLAGSDDARLKPEFAAYEHAELIRDSVPPATDGDSLVQDYEAADPSYMAVTAAIRYWNKFHPEAVSRT